MIPILNYLKGWIYIISNGQINDDNIWSRVRILRQTSTKWLKGIQSNEKQDEEEQKSMDDNQLPLQRIVKDLHEIMSDDTFSDEK